MTTAKELEKENATLRAQVEGLTKRVKELEELRAAARPSKSREQAEKVKAILDRDGKITKDQLLKINPKYSSDPIYYYKNLLKGVVVKGEGAYWTAAAWAKHEEEKAKAEAAKKTAPAAPAASVPTSAA